MAQCYRKEGNYQQALEYYNKVEQVQPDNLNLTLQIGQCLMTLERYDEALAYFFKVEYLDKSHRMPDAPSDGVPSLPATINKPRNITTC